MRKTPRIPEKKKAYRQAMREHAKAGRINRADGVMVPKAQVASNSMTRDYMPNGGGA